MKINKIAIIGGGNLGSAIANGIVASKIVSPSQLVVTRRQVELLNDLKLKGVTVGNDNVAAAKDANIVMLVVKPYFIEAVINEIKEVLTPQTIVVSLATGVTSQDVEVWSGAKLPIFRAMPNTAIAIGQSMTCMSASNATAEQQQLMLDVFNQMGQALIIEEKLMASATILASCGIAFAMRYIRASTEAGVEMGFGAKLATQIAAQTVLGAADLILKGGNHPEVEIDKVTTPAGVTITGLNAMEKNGFSSAVIQGTLTAYEKTQKGK